VCWGKILEHPWPFRIFAEINFPHYLSSLHIVGAWTFMTVGQPKGLAWVTDGVVIMASFYSGVYLKVGGAIYVMGDANRSSIFQGGDHGWRGTGEEEREERNRLSLMEEPRRSMVLHATRVGRFSIFKRAMVGRSSPRRFTGGFSRTSLPLASAWLLSLMPSRFRSPSTWRDDQRDPEEVNRSLAAFGFIRLCQ